MAGTLVRLHFPIITYKQLSVKTTISGRYCLHFSTVEVNGDTPSISFTVHGCLVFLGDFFDICLFMDCSVFLFRNDLIVVWSLFKGCLVFIWDFFDSCLKFVFKGCLVFYLGTF